MARWPTGQTVRVTTAPNGVKDSTGTLATPTSNLITLQKTDGTTVTYADAVVDSVGQLHKDIPSADITVVGHYQWSWTFTFTGWATVAYGSFDTFDPLEVSVISLQDAKAMLNVPAASTTNDAEILEMCGTVEAQIERLIGGPIITRSVTAQHVRATEGGCALAVRRRPIVAVTSIVDTSSSAAIGITDLDIDYRASIIRRKLGLPFLGLGWFYSVTFTAGLGVSAPPAISMAARIILEHLWQTQRGVGGVPGYGGGDEAASTDTGLGYAIPNRALELLDEWLVEAYV